MAKMNNVKLSHNRPGKSVTVKTVVPQGFYLCIHNRHLSLNVYRKIVVYIVKRIFPWAFLYKTPETLVTQGSSPSFLIRRLSRIGDAEKIGNFSTLTAAGRRVYRRAIAETTATKIGVLDTQADDRRCNSGIFSSVAWHSFFGGPCGRVTRLAGPVSGTPILHGLPPRLASGCAESKPTHRSLAMNTTSQKIDDHLLRVACANSIVYLVSLIQSPDNAAPSSELISDALLGANLLIKDSCNQLYEVV